MPSGLKINVRAQLTLTILLAIMVSWLCSSGINNFLTWRQLGAFRTEMLAHPDLYPAPIPEQSFGIWEFLFGYPQRMPAAKNEPEPPASNAPPQQLSSEQLNHQRSTTSVTLFIALVIALLFGVLVSRRFTRPLTALMQGAQAMIAGNFDYRIRLRGKEEFAQLAETLNQMGAQVSLQITQLQNEAQMRRHFMADIAHEFRTPLTTLRTMAGALEDGMANDPERRERAIRSIARTSDRLLRLVTDMLELAKLDLHELPLHRQPVDIRELAASCIQAHADSARQVAVHLQALEYGEPLMAEVDPDRLAQTLDNLLANAINHAGAQAEVSVLIESGPPVRITVTDTGKGIPARHLPFICEPFYRADSARNPGDKHSGLGLRIAKALVEAHGGQLRITSIEGQGTQVEISLPGSSS